jgi:sulfur carrier protein|tara:strand:- start:614 stop:820 length:207 start_codon:yes stop_codon:yes gene_type:complete
MQIKVFIDKENKKEKIELNENSSVKDLLKKLEINPVTVIVSRNDEIILESEKLNEKDEITILSVISGG